MFNNIILKINILPFMIGIRHTDVKDFWKKSCLSTPSHLSVTAPAGHAAPLRCAGTSTASVSLTETSLTFRCGPVGPCYLNLQSLRDSPLLRGATPFLPPRRGTCRRPQACSLIGNSV